jgi:hypothetical protein
MPKSAGLFSIPDNQPAMYSTVILLNEDSVLVKGAFSQQDGSFLIEKIAPGKYFVFIRNIEFKNWISDTCGLGRMRKWYWTPSISNTAQVNCRK